MKRIVARGIAIAGLVIGATFAPVGVPSAVAASPCSFHEGYFFFFASKFLDAMIAGDYRAAEVYLRSAEAQLAESRAEGCPL